MEIMKYQIFFIIISEFKIDLIVWKFVNTITINPKPPEFKIDLIVWKYLIQTAMNIWNAGLK